MRGRGTGWVTAEYAMLPASTGERKERDSKRGRPDGRSIEIQRLIGRALRVVVDFDGARRAGGLGRLRRPAGRRRHPLRLDHRRLRRAQAGALRASSSAASSTALPFTGTVAALSVGVVDGEPLCDLDYSEDSRAEVDANVVMTGDGGLVEVQATAEQTPLSRASLDELLALAEAGITELRDAPGGGDGGVTDRPHRRSIVVATRNQHKLAELGEILTGIDLEPLPDSVDAAARGRRDLRRERARQGAGRPRADRDARRSPTTPGSPPRALGGRPGVRSARYAGRGRDRRGEPRAAARGAAARPTTAPSPTSARSPTSTRTGAETRARGALRGHARRATRAATAASATTRPSSPTTSATAGRWPSSGPRRSTRSPIAAAPRGRSPRRSARRR